MHLERVYQHRVRERFREKEGPEQHGRSENEHHNNEYRYNRSSHQRFASSAVLPLQY